MPRDAAQSQTSPHAVQGHIAELLLDAMRFAPHERGHAMYRKWLDRGDFDQMPEAQQMAMSADALMLSADVLLSLPSSSGSTAFDRMAKISAKAPPAKAAAMLALCGARFRLLRLEGEAAAPVVSLRCVISGALLRVIGTEFPPLSVGTSLFARVAILDNELCCLAGAVTPLDPAAFAIASGYDATTIWSLSGNARWAEAVYSHVVRNGTLEVPGLNRQREGFDDRRDEAERDGWDHPLFRLARAWADLGDQPPDLLLLEKTRHTAHLLGIMDAIGALVATRQDRQRKLEAGLERVLFVQLETVLRRERSGSVTVTLEVIERELAKVIASGRMPSEASAVFAAMRLRLSGSTTNKPSRADDPGLERLVQRIQALREKTVARGCTEPEALAAAEKVAELLDRYGLSLGELEFQAQPCEGVGIQTNRRRAGPMDGCVTVIARFFDCRVWVEREQGGTLCYVFFGLRGDVAAARYLYEMAERAIETETEAFRAGDLYARMEGERRTATNSFQIGLARGIGDKLEALKAARDSFRRSESGRDLVPMKAAIVDEELAKLGFDFESSGRRRDSNIMEEAFVEGKAAAQRFEFAEGIAAAPA